MVFQRFYDDKLSQASFLVGCGATGEAIVIDPLRDADIYIEAAARKRLKITAVTETHIHADYLSGTRELSARTGARMYLSGEGGTDWQYDFADDPLATVVKHGDQIRVGRLRLDVVHTPGHTPEHITLLLTDEPASPTLLGAFTGDFVFVGDVGRPDLLERAANIKGTMEFGGRQLFASLQGFKKNPDGLLVWPAHGAGSACGKSLGGSPVSSVGYEKASNWAFKAATEQEFVGEVLTGQPEPPTYFAMMKKLNKRGPRILGGMKTPDKIGAEQLLRLIDEGAQVIDLRHEDTAMAGFISGTLSIPHDRAFTNWAGWLMKYDQPIYLIATDEEQAKGAARDLALIGHDAVGGWAGEDALSAYRSNKGPLTVVEQLEAASMDAKEMAVLDVRGSNELVEGHVPGSVHIPLGYLTERLKEVPTNGRLAVYCSSGARSPIAVTLLRRLGIENACNVRGGFDEYKNGGRPVAMGGGQPEPAGR